MALTDIPVPHLTTAYSGPLHPIEEQLLTHVPVIESWFRARWLETPPPITSSVDLRHAGYKLAPVDTNLFPAGFNNLNADFMPLCIQAAQAVLSGAQPHCTKILLIPENHTRNQFYMKSLDRLQDIWRQAGFLVQIGSIDPDMHEPREVLLDDGKSIRITPVMREGAHLVLPDFNPCLLLLNNDLSTGVPALLQGLDQPIQPPLKLGWNTRLKSTHFRHFSTIAEAFSNVIGIDPWLINPLFTAVDGVDFMAGIGLEAVADAVDVLLMQITMQYKQYAIEEKPFVVVKSDNGTYGMGVMMVHDANEILHMNRKQRKKMSATKGSQTISRVIVQEGVPSLETMADGSVAEPVVYMMGQYVIGGFYRVHQGRGRHESLNAPGMHFEPLAFASACNTPQASRDCKGHPNRFYTYGVIARLAALAAAYEMKEAGDAR